MPLEVKVADLAIQGVGIRHGLTLPQAGVPTADLDSWHKTWRASSPHPIIHDTQSILCLFSLLSNLEPSLHPKKYTRVHKKSKQRGPPYSTLSHFVPWSRQSKFLCQCSLFLLLRRSSYSWKENLVASLHGVQAKPNRSVSYWEVMPSIFLFLKFNLHGNFYKTSFKFHHNNRHDQCQT